MDKGSISYLFSFSRYQTKCVIKFLFIQLRRHKLRFIFGQPLKQGEKEGKMEIQKFKSLENEKSFLDEIKNIFHSF